MRVITHSDQMQPYILNFLLYLKYWITYFNCLIMNAFTITYIITKRLDPDNLPNKIATRLIFYC